MKVYDLTRMDAFPYEERGKNVFHHGENFKLRIIDLPKGGTMPECEMESNVIFSVIQGRVEVKVGCENAVITEGQCIVTEPATVSMKTESGVRMLGIQIQKERASH